MKTDLHWIDGPWDGKITVVPRPRGGEWLEDEIRDWRLAGVDAVVSLLTDGEVQDLELGEEERLAKIQGMHYFSFPIIDRSVPASRGAVLDLVKALNGLLSQGKDILIHCRGGLGRAPLIAACLLANVGVHPEMAFQSIGAARGTNVPETAEQRQWVTDFAQTWSVPNLVQNRLVAEARGVMALTIAVPLTPDEQVVLEARAKAQGVSVDALLQKAVLQFIATTPDAKQEQLSLAQWEKEFAEWLDGQPDMPTLPDSALSREQIYTREDEWR